MQGKQRRRWAQSCACCEEKDSPGAIIVSAGECGKVRTWPFG